jgi:hypothetical protein
VLGRIAAEGWIERRRTGHGSPFLPMIDAVQTYSESHGIRGVAGSALGR